MLGRARRALGRLEPALADLERGAAIAAETGRETILLQLTLERAVTLVALGRLRDAVAAAEEGLELADLSGSDRLLVWAHATASRAQLAAGAVTAALEHAERAAAAGAQPDLQAAGEPGWSLGNASAAAGNPERAVQAMLASFGGPSLAALPAAARPEAAADLAAAQLAAGDAEGAERTLAGREPVTAPLLLARSAVFLARARTEQALEAALAARAAATGAPLAAARAELAVGRAHAAAGRREEALATLTDAEERLDACGAIRLRDEAVRELRRLGHRVRRSGGARSDGALTAREREIALLVAGGRTNREIAEQLVLSTRTIEAHLRTIYGKLGLRSRVELTRALADEEG
jgi:DNA-binding NarL/FixJ family response regulator